MLRRVQPTHPVTQRSILLLTIIPLPGFAVTVVTERGDDRRILAIMLAGYTIEGLAVILHRLGADALQLDAGIRQRLTQRIAIGAAGFHRHLQIAVCFELHQLLNQQPHLAWRTHAPGTIKGAIAGNQTRHQFLLGHVHTHHQRFSAPALDDRLDANLIDINKRIR